MFIRKLHGWEIIIQLSWCFTGGTLQSQGYTSRWNWGKLNLNSRNWKVIQSVIKIHRITLSPKTSKTHTMKLSLREITIKIDEKYWSPWNYSYGSKAVFNLKIYWTNRIKQKFEAIKRLRRQCTPLQYSCLENPLDRGAW